MSAPWSVITVGIDPNIHLGPLTLAWHGLTIALGIGVGAFVASRWATRRGIPSQPLQTFAAIAAGGGLIGGRLFYVAEHGGPLLDTRGFTFDGGFILAGLAMAAYVRRTRMDTRLLDAAAFGLPLGVAIGRVGDIINGEHYGTQSTFLLAVRNSHPDALTPNPALAYHNGGLYEFLLGIALFAVVWPLRHRLSRPGDLAWLVLGLLAVGRFLEFFLRSDSPQLALGLNNAQWTSVALLVIVLAGRTLTTGAIRRRRSAASEAP